MSIEFSNETTYELDAQGLVRLTQFVLNELHVHPAAELSILAIDEPAMQHLNQTWMDEDRPTDVLSFPMDELRPGNADQPSDPGLLGDLVLCPEYAARAAQEAGRDVVREMQILTAHGLLHLLGYDHAEPEDEKEMFALQEDLVTKFNGGQSPS